MVSSGKKIVKKPKEIAIGNLVYAPVKNFPTSTRSSKTPKGMFLSTLVSDHSTNHKEVPQNNMMKNHLLSRDLFATEHSKSIMKKSPKKKSMDKLADKGSIRSSQRLVAGKVATIPFIDFLKKASLTTKNAESKKITLHRGASADVNSNMRKKTAQSVTKKKTIKENKGEINKLKEAHLKKGSSKGKAKASIGLIKSGGNLSSLKGRNVHHIESVLEAIQKSYNKAY
jgi:hypothetical protein